MAMGDQNDMLARLKAVLPRWFGAASTVLDGAMSGMAYVGSFIYALYAYLVLQTRIRTASDGNLDMVAADFFGPTIMRSQGQTDGSFRAVVIANLFRERGTRAGMTKMLLDVTGRAATCVEPGNPGQVGGWGMPNIGYGVAGAWGTTTHPGTVLITAYLPDGSNGVAAGSLTAQDIYNAVEAVRPIGSTCWVSVQS